MKAGKTFLALGLVLALALAVFTGCRKDDASTLDDTDSGEREVLTSELLGQLRYWESCLEGVITMESKK